MSGMTLALVTSLVCLVAVPSLLKSTRRFDHRPKVGLAVWSALVAVGWLSSIVFFLRVGLGQSSAPILASLRSFIAGLGSGHPLRGVGFREVVGLSLAFDISVLLLASLLRAVATIAVTRHHHRTLIDLVASPVEGHTDVCVLEHSQPLAYFLPGQGGRVVVTQGAVDVLSQAELDAVIFHERGHRDGHHGAWLVSLQALSPFMQFVPLARFAPTTMRMYLEMSADDFARVRVPRTALEGALGKVSLFGAAPLGAMCLTNDFAARRVERLATARPLVLDSAIVFAVASACVSLMWFVSLGRF